MTESFLSQVERGVASPSIASVQRIARALGPVDRGAVRGRRARRARRPRRDRRRVVYQGLGAIDEFLTRATDGRLQVILSTIEPGRRHRRRGLHPRLRRGGRRRPRGRRSTCGSARSTTGSRPATRSPTPRASRIATPTRARASRASCSASRRRRSEPASARPSRLAPIGLRSMYAVVMAGGGGTRLWPLSRAETPKPFLPLLDERSLLQRTVDRIVGHAGARAAAGRRRGRHRAPLRADGPRAAAGRPRHRRAARAATPPPRSRSRRCSSTATRARSCSSCRPMPGSTRSATACIARSSGPPRGIARDGAFGVEAPLVTLGVQTERPATEYGYLIPDYDAGAVIDGVKAYPLSGSRRSRTASARTSCTRSSAWPGTRASSCGSAARSATRSIGTRG